MGMSVKLEMVVNDIFGGHNLEQVWKYRGGSHVMKWKKFAMHTPHDTHVLHNLT
jgi:hypothetical protein